MRTVMNVLLGIAFLLAWCTGLVYVIGPENMLEMEPAIMGVFQSFTDIDDEPVPLSGFQDGNGKTEHGWLKVQNGKLVSEAGQPVQLRGMSSHGIAWYPEYTGRAAIQTTKSYGANVFRVAMYVDDMPGNYTADIVDQKRNKEAMYAAVDSALSLDMYVIVDWHVLEDGNPMNRVEQAEAFFAEMAEKYKDEPGVIYEICNEPNGEATWDDISLYAGRVIPIIRKHAPQAVVIVGTPDYSWDIGAAVERPLTCENVLYAFHYYSATHQDTFREVLEAALAVELPIFVSEWGFGGHDTSELGEQHGRAFLAYLAEKGISWVNWSLSNKEETHSAIRADIEELSGWEEGDLTISGQIVFGALGR